MNFSENISNKLTELITNELDYDEDKKEIITYAIESALLFVLGFLLIMLIGYIFQALIPAVIAAVFGGLLRRLSGGAHFNTPVKCLAFGALVYGLLGVLAKKLVAYNLIDQYVLVFGLLISFFLVACLAPVDSEAKPIYSSSLKIKLKILALVFLSISCLIVYFTDNPVLRISAVLGVSYQSLTLLPMFNRRR